MALRLAQAGDIESLRFNADTATLPPWLPPYSCAPGLATAQWWQSHSAAQQAGAHLMPLTQNGYVHLTAESAGGSEPVWLAYFQPSICCC